MRYEQISSGSHYPYPDMAIDPAKKGKDFCMQYAKAAYHDWNFSYPKGVLSNNGGDYQKFKLYAQGKQPITQYKRWAGVDQKTDQTWMNIDWSVRPVVLTYRDKALSRLMKQDHRVIATAIDSLAKSEMETWYNDMKAKLAVRKLMQQQNPELANHPMLQLQTGDPMDLEELEMRLQMGEQFNRSMDAEMAIELGFYENGVQMFRRAIYEDLFDWGLCGYKEWLGDDNKAKFRRVDLEAAFTSYCKKADFSDMVHAGEVIDVSLVDLALVTDENGNKMFTEDDLRTFAGTLAGKFGNPAMIGRGSGFYKPYDKFKCKVVDIEFYSYDEHNYRKDVDEEGNVDFRKADYNRGKKAVDKYTRKCFKTVYKCKWIIGTDFAYDWGLASDQKRSTNPKKKAETSLSYKFHAINFYEMKATGYMERLIPYLDEYQLTIYKIQNFKNRAVPSGWWIDLDALENVALTKGATSMEPKELLQMFFETGALMGRSHDPSGQPMGPNWKPVIPIENTAASELAMFYQDLVQTIQQIERMTGFNEVTMGEANPRTLVPGYEVANMSTNDALYPLAFAESQLVGSLAADVLCRMQQGVKKGVIEGYMPLRGALNSNALTFLSISPNIAAREYGIMLEEKTSDEQKMWLLQTMQGDITNGFLDSADAIMIVNTHNAKQAMMVLSYKVRKAKEQQAQQQMDQINANNQGAQQAAQIAAQMKQQEEQMKADLSLREKMAVMAEEREQLRMKLESAEKIAAQTNMTKVVVQETANEKPVSSSN